MVLEPLKKMTFFSKRREAFILLSSVKTRRPEFLIVFKFSPAEVEVRPKGGSEILIKMHAEIMPTFVMRLEYVMSGLDGWRFSRQQKI